MMGLGNMKMGVATKALILLVVISIVPVVSIGVTSYYAARGPILGQVKAQAEAWTHEKLHQLQLRLSGAVSDIGAWSRFSVMQEVLIEDPFGDIWADLRRLKGQSDLFAELMVADRNGRVISAAHDVNIGKIVTDTPAFQAIINGRSAYHGPVEVSSFTGSDGITVAVPIAARYDESRVIGVFIGVVDWQPFVQELSGTGLVADAQRVQYQLSLIDRKTGTVLFPENLSATAAADDPGIFVVQAETGPHERSGLVDPGWTLKAAISEASMAAGATGVAEQIGLGVVLLIAAAVAAAFLIRKYVVQPLMHLITALNLIGQGKYDTPVPALDRQDEIGQMANAIRLFKELSLQRERQHEEVLAMHRLAVEADASKAAFLASTSHELRTPLNAILGYSEMMLSGILGPMSPPIYKEYAQNIHESGAHLLSLINDLLDLSKTQAGKSELYPTVIDPVTVASSCSQIVKTLANKAEVSLTTNFAPNLGHLNADERRLKQILINLLSNAVKFTKPGGAVELKVYLNAADETVFEIRDSGIGISADQIPLIFEPYRRVKNEWTRSREGTGLGLPLTAMLIKLHGGSINIDSKVGHGTTVTVRFPPERTVRPAESEDRKGPKLRLVAF